MLSFLPVLLLAVSLDTPAMADSDGSVYCDAVYQTRNGRTFRVSVTCPDVEHRESLQRQAEQQVEEARSVLRDVSIRDLPGRVHFRRVETANGVDWQVQPGVISRINAYYPRNPVRANVSAACTARYDIVEGEPENICIVCRATDFRGDYIREMRRAIRRSFFVDTSEPVEQVFSVEFPLPDAPSPGIPPAPDCSEDSE
ncbi:hypothetical protein V0U79_12970 [Hyphobacterium sp. HN65]|uniref:TonB C-terminal domain-containing protein n=1 Tax=Hyphobacterium lacteum TaxID=3116575 RepID=A0ABU7LTP3_9PROT|nr:hypothetical protein [Hyphobacterium sp. HN65]MEE2527271.1 hypothetical protein [Hyphobacterium sp. HN65]